MTTTPTTLDTRREKERAKYVSLAAKPGSTYGSTNHGKLAVPIIQNFKPRFVVDFGCGRNDLVRYLRRLGIDGLGVDFASAPRGRGRGARGDAPCGQAARPLRVLDLHPSQ
jgi:hypothetical protein